MKKRNVLIFGLLAVALAFSVVLTGCDDPNKDNGGDDDNYLKWPSAFAPTYVESAGGNAGMWESNSGAGMLFAISPAQKKSYVMAGSEFTAYLLTAVNGTTFTVQEEDGGELTGSAWTFTAAVASSTLTVSTSGQPSIVPTGAYTSAEIPTE